MGRVWESVSTVGPYDLLTGAEAGRRASVSPVRGNVTAMNAKAPVQLPAVSVIMPVLNEERHLRGAVRAILAQEYAGEMEVVIALGPSADRTDEIAAELVREDARVHTVPNPTGRTPAALNAAIKASRHPVVVRVDGHGILSPNYIATAVRLLEETGAQNVGGIMHAEGENDWEHAVAAAMTRK